MTFSGGMYNPHNTNKKGSTKKGKFVPSSEQISTCMARIEGALKKYRGRITHSSAEGVRKSLVGMVFNRDRALGEDRDEVCETVKHALARMEGTKVRWDDEGLDTHLIYLPYERGRAPIPYVNNQGSRQRSAGSAYA